MRGARRPSMPKPRENVEQNPVTSNTVTDLADVTVHIADSALMHLLLAGVESYFKRRKNEPLETGGLLWGSIKEPDDDMAHITIQHVSTDTYGKRSPKFFALNDTSTQAKCDILARRWPHLDMVGDFHTHPYLSNKDVLDNKGWEFSCGDYKSYEDCTPESWAGRVGLVLTLAELQRYYPDKSIDPQVKTRHGNIIQWQIGRYRFWLSAYAVDAVGDRLVVSPKSGSTRPRRYVYIDVPTINGTDAWFNYRDA